MAETVYASDYEALTGRKPEKAEVKTKVVNAEAVTAPESTVETKAV